MLSTQVFNVSGLRKLFHTVDKKTIEKIKTTDKWIYFFTDGHSLFVEFKKKNTIGAFDADDLSELIKD